MSQRERHRPAVVQTAFTAPRFPRLSPDVGLKQLTTPVCSSQSNGMAESFER
jgi:transposase InsO family protein